MRIRTISLAAAIGLLAPLALIEAPAAKAAATCAPATHAGGEWRDFGNGLDNTRHQAAETTIGPAEAIRLAPVWTFDVGANGGDGGVTGTPVIADGCAYIASDGGDVFAVNADTGEVVWHATVPSGGGINSTVAVHDGRVYANVSRSNSPYSIALSQADGSLLWETLIDEQPGADSYASPVVYEGTVFAGVSGGAAELGGEEERYAFQGAYVLLDSATGAIKKKTWVIHDPSFDDGFAGATIWSTPAVDTETGFAYVGAGNPFQPHKEHAHANSVLKIDLRPGSTTFGEIVGSYKGLVDEYFPFMSDLPCGDIEGNPPPWYPQGVGACFDVDLDFGASPNIFRDSTGAKVVGAGQKAGVYHAFDPDTMGLEWTSLIGPGGALGGIVGTATVTEHGIAGPQTVGGTLWSIEENGGALQWTVPTADGAHWGHQTSSANGVVYTMDLKGFIQAFDAVTGAPLLHRSLAVGSDASQPAGGLGGGVAIARNTVYVPSNGFVVALKPGALTPSSSALPSSPAPTPVPVAPVITSGPGGFAAGYITRAMVAQQGGTITYANLDIAQHDVVAKQYGAGDRPWCTRFRAGQCPIFASPLIGVGQTTQVQGLDQVTPGAVYDFYCTLHPNMQGNIVITP